MCFLFLKPFYITLFEKIVQKKTDKVIVKDRIHMVRMFFLNPV